jgi:DNA-binding NarL/FixJ family response regulator
VLEADGLCAAAGKGQILVLDTVFRLAGPTTSHTFAAHEAVAIPGLSKPVELFEVGWEPSGKRPLTVVIADDSVLLRSGIAGLLASHNFRVVGEAGDAVQLLELVDALRPDLAVVDIRMPPTHTLEGIRAAARLKEQYPRMGVLILSQHLESRAALSLLEEHKQRIGYLLKDRVGDVSEFVAALLSIAEGGTALDRDVVARLMGRRRVDDPIEGLSAREIEVLSLMAEGLSNQAISERLTLGVRTVEAHIATIFSKLGLEPESDAHRRVLAVVAFLRRP